MSRVEPPARAVAAGSEDVCSDARASDSYPHPFIFPRLLLCCCYCCWLAAYRYPFPPSLAVCVQCSLSTRTLRTFFRLLASPCGFVVSGESTNSMLNGLWASRDYYVDLKDLPRDEEVTVISFKNRLVLFKYECPLYADVIQKFPFE